MLVAFTEIDLAGMFEAGSVYTYNSCAKPVKTAQENKKENKYFTIKKIKPLHRQGPVEKLIYRTA